LENFSCPLAEPWINRKAKTERLDSHFGGFIAGREAQERVPGSNPGIPAIKTSQIRAVDRRNPDGRGRFAALPDDSWKGWWGEEPPYHTAVFVLTHHPRAPLMMKGGTVFRFVTDGIHAALQQARDAADGRDIRLGGGVSTIRQYLQAALIDELHLAIAPVLLGTGEHLLNGIDIRALGYECVEHVAGARAAAHVILRKRV
jgi:dihydrofolate reductase